MDRKSEGGPQNYLKEYLFVSAVVLAGFALQFATGMFGFAILAFPVNLIFLAIFILLMAVKPSRVLTRFGSIRVSILLIAILIVFSIVMGVVPRNNIKCSWPFVLVYLMLLTSLSLVIGRKIRKLFQERFEFKRVSFILNHLGLFLIMFSAGFGSADIQRYFMTVTEGEIEWRGVSTVSDRFVELPVAIKLNDFKMEEYPAKLLIVDTSTGMPVKMKEWKISVDSVIEKKRFAPAAYIRASKPGTDCLYKGWISCGNYFQPRKILDLNNGLCIAMEYPEPKSFSSSVQIVRKRGDSGECDYKDGNIEVNHPLTIGQWKIYQYSYNTMMGKDSEYSIFELVYDPWLIPAYIGIIMLFAGVVTLFWRGGKK